MSIFKGRQSQNSENILTKYVRKKFFSITNMPIKTKLGIMRNHAIAVAAFQLSCDCQKSCEFRQAIALRLLFSCLVTAKNRASFVCSKRREID